MAFVANLIDGIVKSIPILVNKIVTTFLIVFFLGVLFGIYVLAFKGPLALAGLALVIAAIYYKLDEGFLILVLYFGWVFFF